MVLECENWLQSAFKLMQTSYTSTLRNILIHLNAEAPLGISIRGVKQIFDRRKDWNWGSVVLISKILGVSIDTPDTPLTGPLFSNSQF